METASSRTAAPASGPAIVAPGSTTTIILVRHGEREGGFNPPLNEAGRARAQALLEALDESGIAAIYAPDLLRTIQTAEPLAERLDLPIHRIELVRLVVPSWLARDLISQILARHAGQVVLYVGNDSNLEAIYEYLGGMGPGPIRHGDMCTVVIDPAGEVHFIKSRFGKSD